MVSRKNTTNGHSKLYIFRGISVTTARCVKNGLKSQLGCLGILLVQSFCSWMTLLGDIERMWCLNTCKQKLSLEWICHFTHLISTRLSMCEMLRVPTFSVPNFFPNTPKAEKWTFRRLACNSQSFITTLVKSMKSRYDMSIFVGDDHTLY